VLDLNAPNIGIHRFSGVSEQQNKLSPRGVSLAKQRVSIGAKTKPSTETHLNIITFKNCKHFVVEFV